MIVNTIIDITYIEKFFNVMKENEYFYSETMNTQKYYNGWNSNEN